SRQIEQAIFMHQKWDFGVLFVEENNFQGILKENYRRMQEQHSYFRVAGVHQHQNKMKRIASMEPLITNGQLLFNQDLNQRFISQINLFPTTHDDGPDALQGVVGILSKTIYRIG
ncbi:MAG: phage terminase large subunit, partial [Cyanobacteria bacterium]|nr:phage terminase large subunit [Cyanobacteriota bacterium]